MRKYTLILYAVLATLVMSSCVSEDYDPEKCDKRIRIEFLWMNTAPIDEDEIIPISISSLSRSLVEIYSEVEGTDVNLSADEYHLVGHELAANADISGNNVYVNTSADGMAMEPGSFSAGIADASVDPSLSYQVIKIPMYHQTRELVIRAQFTGDGASLLQQMDGTMDGIALERHILDGFPPANSELRPPATRSGSINMAFAPDGEGFFTARRTLLGIDGANNQNLDLRVLLTSMNYADVSLDITEAMDGFHTYNVTQPYYIILIINLGADFTMTIEDWVAGDDQYLEAS